MTGASLVFVGAGGHARACIDVVELQGKYRIAGLVGTESELHDDILGYPVLATDGDLPELVRKYENALICVGQIGSPDGRMHLFDLVTKLGFRTPTIIAADAGVSRHATIGEGTIVMRGAIVNAGAVIGDNCIVNSNALVEHGSVVQDHCHISTGAIINGDVRIGSGSFIGSGSVIKESVTLGHRCLVGMGLALRHDLPDGSRFPRVAAP